MDFYTLTVDDECLKNPEPDGFCYSVILGERGRFRDRPEPQQWKSLQPSLLTRVLDFSGLPDSFEVLLFIKEIPEGYLDVIDLVADGAVDVVGKTKSAWEKTKGKISQVINKTGDKIRSFISLIEFSDSAIEHDVMISDQADLFTFDFVFADKGDGDWLTLHFNDALLWSFRGDAFSGVNANQATVPLSELAGQAGRLRFTLHGIGEPNAVVYLGNFQIRQSVKIVSLDIDPETKANLLDLENDESISVAILSTEDFDAPLEIDQASLTFGMTGDETSLDSCEDDNEDVNSDGLPDLICDFEARASEFQPGETEGILKGDTIDGVPIVGRDTVTVVTDDDDDDDDDND